MQRYIKVNSLEDRNTLMAVLFQQGYIYDRGDRNFSTVAGMSNIPGHYKNVCLHYRGVEKNIMFCPGYIDFEWPSQASEVLKYLSSKQPTIVDDVGEYSATVTETEIKVGCQTISFEKFDELVKAVDSMRTKD